MKLADVWRHLYSPQINEAMARDQRERAERVERAVRTSQALADDVFTGRIRDAWRGWADDGTSDSGGIE